MRDVDLLVTQMLTLRVDTLPRPANTACAAGTQKKPITAAWRARPA